MRACFLILFFPILSGALDYSGVKEFAKSNSYTDNRRDVKNEPYYLAHRDLDPQATFTVKIFFDDPGKTKIRQLIFEGQKCSNSIFDDENFIGALKTELQIFFASFSKEAFPETLVQEIKSSEPRTKKELESRPEGIHKMRITRGEIACKGQPSGYKIALDLFPKL
jgi:hypothetical protein